MARRANYRKPIAIAAARALPQNPWKLGGWGILAAVAFTYHPLAALGVVGLAWWQSAR